MKLIEEIKNLKLDKFNFQNPNTFIDKPSKIGFDFDGLEFYE